MSEFSRIGEEYARQSTGHSEAEHEAGPWDDNYRQALESIRSGSYGDGLLKIKTLLHGGGTPSQSEQLRYLAQEALTAVELSPNYRQSTHISTVKSVLRRLFPDQAPSPSPQVPTVSTIAGPLAPPAPSQVPEAPRSSVPQAVEVVNPDDRLALYLGEGIADQTRARGFLKSLGGERVSPQGFGASGLIKEDVGEAWVEPSTQGRLAVIPIEQPGVTHDLVPVPWLQFNEPQRLMLEQFFDVEDVRPENGPPEYYVELIRPTKMNNGRVVEKGALRLAPRNTWIDRYRAK